MFQLLWRQEAIDGIATIWMKGNSDERNKITSAIHLLDELLRHDPENAGESRGDSLRIYFDLPLVVSFRCDVENSLVRVLQVWSAGTRK